MLHVKWAGWSWGKGYIQLPSNLTSNGVNTSCSVTKGNVNWKSTAKSWKAMTNWDQRFTESSLIHESDKVYVRVIIIPCEYKVTYSSLIALRSCPTDGSSPSLGPFLIVLLHKQNIWRTTLHTCLLDHQLWKWNKDNSSTTQKPKVWCALSFVPLGPGKLGTQCLGGQFHNHT